MVILYLSEFTDRKFNHDMCEERYFLFPVLSALVWVPNTS